MQDHPAAAREVMGWENFWAIAIPSRLTLIQRVTLTRMNVFRDFDSRVATLSFCSRAAASPPAPSSPMSLRPRFRVVTL